MLDSNLLNGAHVHVRLIISNFDIFEWILSWGENKFFTMMYMVIHYYWGFEVMVQSRVPLLLPCTMEHFTLHVVVYGSGTNWRPGCIPAPYCLEVVCQKSTDMALESVQACSNSAHVSENWELLIGSNWCTSALFSESNLSWTPWLYDRLLTTLSLQP